MASDFDQFPLYDSLVNENSYRMSSTWQDFMATFYMNLTEYLTSGGIRLPQLTTEQRDQLKNIPNGQMIYNTTLDTAQYVKSGIWTSF